jgi:hypothetical protein
MCGASKIVEHDDWPTEFNVLGDKEFVCTNNFLTPCLGRSTINSSTNNKTSDNNVAKERLV